MALNFPDNPSLNDIYTDSTSGFSYQWDGVVWQSYTPASSKNISILDDISGSFNGTQDTFAITVSGTALTPANSQQLRIVLGGVIQEPNVDYSVSGSNLIFTTPPVGALSFSGVSLGPAIPVNTIPNGTVTDGSLRISTTAVVGSATTFTEDLVVSGDARVTGILTVGSSSITLDGSTNTITVGSGVTIDGDSGSISATSFSGDGSGLTGVVSGVGIATAGGTVGTGATVLNFRGTGISTVTVASGIGTIFIEGGGGGDRFTTITPNQTTSKTIVNKEFCVVTTGGLTITLPSSPAAGNEVAVGIATTSTNTVIGRNGSNIMSLAENLTVDTANVVVNLVYTDATRGWRIV